jgi:hypothetical protein
VDFIEVVFGESDGGVDGELGQDVSVDGLNILGNAGEGCLAFHN